MDVDEARLQIKRDNAVPRLHNLADFLADYDEVAWSWRFREIAIHVEACNDREAIWLYLDMFWDTPQKFTGFYCAAVARLPKHEAENFRTLFSHVACAMANIRQYLFDGIDKPPMRIRRPRRGRT